MAALFSNRLRRQLPLHHRRRAHHQGSGRHILGDNRTSSHQGAGTDGDAIENDGANPHQASILERGAVDHGPMANGDVGTESHRLPRITMVLGTVLNIAARSDPHLLQIAARNS